MKRFQILILAIMLASLSACATNSLPSSSTESSVSISVSNPQDFLSELEDMETSQILEELKISDGGYPHGDADEKGLQEKPEQGANVHLHQAGLQHGKPNVVDAGVSGNDAAGIGHHLLGNVEHCHHDVESIADEPDRNSSLKDPAHDEGRLKLRHIVMLSDHLDQFITGDEG